MIRSLLPTDVPAVRALFEDECERHPYALRTIELVTSAGVSDADDAEYRGIVYADERAVRGAVVFGLVAGAVGTGMIYGVAVTAAHRRRGVGLALVEAACEALVASGARVAIAELPDDAVLSEVHALLARARFREESRAPDLIRDGVAVVFRRRDLAVR